MRVLVFVLTSVLFSSIVNGQAKKFGKIDVSDFTNYNLEYDTSAAAVVLFDIGRAYFDASMECFFERHVRLKILNEDGFEYGDIAVVFNEDLDQDVDKIRASTYNIEGNKIETVKLKRQGIFEERIFDDYRVKKFTLPALSKGSIIEYSYRKRAGNPFQLPDWTFHKEIPVQYSEYQMRIPYMLSYQTIIKGVDTALVKKVDSYNDALGGGRLLTVSKSDLPPVIDIPFINSTDDFVTEILNQLQEAHFPGGQPQRFLKDWGKVADEIRSHPGIGKQRLNGEMKKEAERIANQANSSLDKMKLVFDYVSTAITWDGVNRLVSEKGIRSAFKDKTGSSADINIMLAEMLKHVGVKTHLGFISTKDHGEIITNYPIVNQFNHVIAVSEIDSSLYVLDATEGERSYKLPPIKNLYRRVLLIENKGSSWIFSQPLERSSSTEVLNYNIQPDGTLELSFDSRYSGYFAHDFRRRVKGTSALEVGSSYLNDYNDAKIDSADFKQLDEKEKYVSFNMDLKIGEKDTLETHKDFIYLNPFLFLAENESPFKKSDRDFPVFFDYPYKKRIVINISIPNGYEVDDLPKSGSLVVGENLAILRYLVKEEGNRITLLSDFSINAIRFEAADYNAIKDLFEKQVFEHARQIVIKKL